MARGNNRGGYQAPERPAPVSGPGALSQRTDGGPGSDTQPLRAASGGNYGDRKATLDAQRAAPLPDNTPSAPSVPEGGSAPATAPAAAVPTGSVFGPTKRPGESPLAGAQVPGSAVTDPDTLLRLVYSAFPHPQLLRLIRRS